LRRGQLPDGIRAAGAIDFDVFERLAAIITAARGKFLLSINDTPEVREIFSAFEIRDIETTWTISSEAKKVNELIISNFAPV
jgi:DNA adenine methylase